jgi:hypothetical protein
MLHRLNLAGIKIDYQEFIPLPKAFIMLKVVPWAEKSNIIFSEPNSAHRSLIEYLRLS